MSDIANHQPRWQTTQNMTVEQYYSIIYMQVVQCWRHPLNECTEASVQDEQCERERCTWADRLFSEQHIAQGEVHGDVFGSLPEPEGIPLDDQREDIQIIIFIQPVDGD